MNNAKPFQWLAWLGTAGLVVAACFASFVPHLLWHHALFIISNAIWAAVGYLWKEQSLIALNFILTIVYIIGLIYNT
jgi:hypothetical protein